MARCAWVPAHTPALLSYFIFCMCSFVHDQDHSSFIPDNVLLGCTLEWFCLRTIIYKLHHPFAVDGPLQPSESLALPAVLALLWSIQPVLTDSHPARDECEAAFQGPETCTRIRTETDALFNFRSSSITNFFCFSFLFWLEM